MLVQHAVPTLGIPVPLRDAGARRACWPRARSLARTTAAVLRGLGIDGLSGDAVVAGDGAVAAQAGPGRPAALMALVVLRWGRC